MNAGRALLTTALALLLGACWWEGPVFYQPDPTRAGPIEPGEYEVVNSEGGTERVRLVRAPNGGYVSDRGKPDDPPLVFVPLAYPGRDLWVSEMIVEVSDNPVATYGLLERRGGVSELLPFIDCEGNEAIVRANGGIVTPKSGDGSPGPMCRFNDAASLNKALAAFAAAHPRLPGAAILTRIDR